VFNSVLPSHFVKPSNNGVALGQVFETQILMSRAQDAANPGDFPLLVGHSEFVRNNFVVVFDSRPCRSNLYAILDEALILYP
jgi:hypothetical protein